MTLTGRVSAFFLGWLGLTLAGFAAAVYLVARADLYRDADARLTGTLDVLVAAAEVEPEGIEWDPRERTLPRGDDPASVTWLIAGPGGAVDRSGPAAGDWLRSAPVGTTVAPDGTPWRLARRRLEVGRGNQPPARELLADRTQRVTKFRALELSVALPLGPIRGDLRRLAWVLGGLTAGLWLTAAVVGPWLCRRTVAPVRAMAAAARDLSPHDPDQRLAVRPTGDELEDLGRAFNGALGRLQEAFERQRRFTAEASHQFRTPLAAVLGQVEVALRRDREPAEYRETLRAVGAEVGRLNRLTEALLFLARADAEAVLPDLARVDLKAWLATQVTRWRAANPDTRLLVEADDAVPAVSTHAELLAQLLDNLLENAVKYGPATGPVRIRLRAREGGVELIVEDEGPGIAADDLPLLFEPFFRSSLARGAGVRGVGLGLSVARRIAEAMGARLTAASEPGRGSRFAVYFPVEEPKG